MDGKTIKKIKRMLVTKKMNVAVTPRGDGAGFIGEGDGEGVH